MPVAQRAVAAVPDSERDTWQDEQPRCPGVHVQDTQRDQREVGVQHGDEQPSRQHRAEQPELDLPDRPRDGGDDGRQRERVGDHDGDQCCGPASRAQRVGAVEQCGVHDHGDRRRGGELGHVERRLDRRLADADDDAADQAGDEELLRRAVDESDEERDLGEGDREAVSADLEIDLGDVGEDEEHGDAAEGRPASGRGLVDVRQRPRPPGDADRGDDGEDGPDRTAARARAVRHRPILHGVPRIGHATSPPPSDQPGGN